jgi:KDO2-lipid IV(A) lauroyltransferase
VRRTDPARFVLAAFRFFGRAPEWLSRAICAAAAELVWLLHGSGVRQLEANLAVARPDASPRDLRRLSRTGMQNYLRYFAEAFALPRLSAEQIDARVRAVGIGPLLDECGRGRAVVLALGHQGNWDLAGAWAAGHLAPATTVVERLEPPEMYDEFLRMREAVGMSIIPLDKGQDVFRRLVQVVRGGHVVVPLLSDRDLTARGVEVDLLGQRARVAAGPAALAIATGTMVTPTTIRHERLRGARRRAAGSPWGIVVTFHPALAPVKGVPRSGQVGAMTQGWVDTLGADIARYPTHWHMLQKVFVAHLDPQRYAATVAGEKSAS